MDARTATLLPMFACLAGLAAACAGPSEPSTPVTTGTPSAPGDAFALELQDAAGRTLHFQDPPQRIVVAGHGTFIVLHTLYLFSEGRDRLVGVEQRGPSVSDFLPLVEDGFPCDRGILQLGAGPEHIAALRPDVVLMKYTADTRMSESLQQVGIPSVYLGLEGPDQFARDVEILGRLLDSEERAQEIIGYYDERLERLEQGTRGLADRPRVLVVEYHARGGTAAVQVPAAPWMQTEQVRLAGGDPVWLDAAERTYGWTVVNFEQIARWDPDQLYVVVWHQFDPDELLENLRSDAHWSQLRAVKDGQLHAYPADIYGWDSPEPRWILGALWLAHTMHPGRFGDIDMDVEIEGFFGALYDMDRDAVQAGIVPRLRTYER